MFQGDVRDCEPAVADPRSQVAAKLAPAVLVGWDGAVGHLERDDEHLYSGLSAS
jgi:hypothetical protein